MRKTFFLTAVFFCTSFTQLNAQSNSRDKQTLPEGIKIVGNQIIVQPGYTATPIKGKNIVVVAKGKEPKFRFSCICTGDGHCDAITKFNKNSSSVMIACIPKDCDANCDAVWGPDESTTIIPHLTDAPQSEIDKLKWKRVIF